MPTTATPTMTIAEADQRLARDEYDFIALMAKGDHHFGLGELRAAGSFFDGGIVAQSGRLLTHWKPSGPSARCRTSSSSLSGIWSNFASSIAG